MQKTLSFSNLFAISTGYETGGQGHCSRRNLNTCDKTIPMEVNRCDKIIPMEATKSYFEPASKVVVRKLSNDFLWQLYQQGKHKQRCHPPLIMFMSPFLHLRLIFTNVSFHSSLLGNELIVIANINFAVHLLINSISHQCIVHIQRPGT